MDTKLNLVYQWVGGKTKIINTILENVPGKINTYIEPFLGGASVFLNIKPKKAIINDINKSIYDTFTCIKNNVDICNKMKIRIKELKENIDNDKSIYEKLRKDFNNTRDCVDFIILNRYCYNGLYRENSKGEFNVPYNKKPINCNFINDKYIENIKNINEYLNENNIEIYNKDYIDILNKAREGDFVYIDPPYYPKNENLFTRYNKSDFTKQDHINLKNEIDKLNEKNVKFLLSNSNTDFIKNLYKDYNISFITTNAVLNCKKDKRKNTYEELLIKNF